jgi:hypothetical protein
LQTAKNKRGLVQFNLVFGQLLNQGENNSAKIGLKNHFILSLFLG